MTPWRLTCFSYNNHILFYFLQTACIDISEYSSENENVEECQEGTTASNLELPKNLQLSFGAESELDTGRSATDWLKSAQAVLKTPKKKIDKSTKNLDNSAKKQKLLRSVYLKFKI